jgi:hypothetical protein
MASEATSSQIKAYLSFHDSSGNQSRLEQLKTGSMTSPVCHFLANEETNELLFVTEGRDALHSHACISILGPGFTALLCH